MWAALPAVCESDVETVSIEEICHVTMTRRRPHLVSTHSHTVTQLHMLHQRANDGSELHLQVLDLNPKTLDHRGGGGLGSYSNKLNFPCHLSASHVHPASY